MSRHLSAACLGPGNALPVRVEQYFGEVETQPSRGIERPGDAVSDACAVRSAELCRQCAVVLAWISAAYSAIVLSLENLPAPAMFRIAFRARPSSSA